MDRPRQSGCGVKRSPGSGEQPKERHLRPADNATARAQKGRNPANLHPGVQEEAEIILTFDDNRLASLVFGHYDQNLAHLERRLNVVAIANGNRVTLKGTPEGSELARRVLEKLYERARGRADLGPGDVDGTIEESTLQGTLFPTAEEPVPGLTAFDQVATRKRGAVRARNAAQNTYIKALKQNELVFAEGPAGTGKTWLAVGYAVSLLEAGQVDRCPATCARRSTRTCARSTTRSTISWTRGTWTGASRPA
jgi:phosphate starvation-inducible PhoH-like protein